MTSLDPQYIPHLHRLSRSLHRFSNDISLIFLYRVVFAQLVFEIVRFDTISEINYNLVVLIDFFAN